LTKLGKEPPSWRRAAAIAVAYVLVVVVGSTIAIVHEERSVRTNPAFHRVMWQMRAAVALAVVAAIVVHRSSRIVGLVVLIGLFGWLFCEMFGTWAYSSIGGGP